MSLRKEIEEVDYFVDPRPLTLKEEEAISAFIKADKEKRKLKISKQKRLITKKTKVLA